MNAPFFSVLIPTCNRNDLLELCLDRLSPEVQKSCTKDYEVIVSDDSKTGNAKSLVEKYPWARWVPGPQKGPAANRNAAASHASGLWLAFTDDDCIPDSNWLSAFDASIEKNDKNAFEGQIRPLSETPLKDLWKCPINEHGGNFWSANILVKKSFFQKMGGFDAAFPYPASEDTDLYWRIKKIEDVPFISSAIIEHPVILFTLKDALIKDFKTLDSRAYLLSKHCTDSFSEYFKTIFREIKIYSMSVLYGVKNGFLKNIILSALMLIFGVPKIAFKIIIYKNKK